MVDSMFFAIVDKQMVDAMFSSNDDDTKDYNQCNLCFILLYNILGIFFFIIFYLLWFDNKMRLYIFLKKQII